MAGKLLQQSQPTGIKNRLEHIVSLANAKKNTVKPSEVGDDLNKVYLSDCKWGSAKVGWRRAAANHYYLERRSDDRLLLEIDGDFFPKGLYAHSPSTYTFDLGGKWKSFSTSFGFERFCQLHEGMEKGRTCRDQSSANLSADGTPSRTTL